MKSIVFIILLSVECIFSISVIANDMIKTTAQGTESVILLHGLARSSMSMNKMAAALRKEGYRVCNISYPSTKYSISDLSKNHVFPRISEWVPEPSKPIHFVAHSMGCIIVRELIKTNLVKNSGRVVMLSPPNKGTEVVDSFGDFWLFKLINGPAGRELGTDASSKPNRLGPADFEVGIMTGNSTINPLLSWIIPGKEDGKISIERAKLEGMKDFLVVPVSHPFIMKNRSVIRQTIFFLKHGKFQKQDNS
jgi:pimeloyl-ACP methyl ester carboxylesterase